MKTINEDLIYKFVNMIEEKLLPYLLIESIHPHEPIIVHNIPEPWVALGVGNYAAAIYHPNFPELIVKVYAEGRPGIEEEIEVYKKLGCHSAYSQCYYYNENYLILKRLKGRTLFDCLRKGIQIPEKIIKDIDEALDYAKLKGLHPHDVHIKNVMMIDNQGVVVDVSDFCHEEYCSLWKDLKKAYYKIYLPFIYKLHIPMPSFLLNLVRKGYRFFKR